MTAPAVSPRTCRGHTVAEHTGGMLALIPDDIEALTIEGGEPADELHLTLLYLGDDVTTWPQGQADRLRELITASAPALDPVNARVFGHALFNPDGKGGDTCQVYLIGETTDLDPLRRWAYWVMTSGEDYVTPPEQRTPFIPHVTAKYGRGAHLTYTGPVRFSTLRLVLADAVLDVALGDQEADVAVQAKSITFTPPQAIRDYAHTWTVWRDDETATAVVEGKALDGNGLAWVAANCGDIGRKWALDMLGRIEVKAEPTEGVETKVMSPSPNAAKLRSYWAHGEGRAKWNPGTPGDFKRLRRKLRKYVKNPKILNGLTANIHKLATGEWPGPKAHTGKKSLVDWDSVEIEVKAIAAVDEALLHSGVDDWGGIFVEDWTQDYLTELGAADTTDDIEDLGDDLGHFAAIGATMVADPDPVVEEVTVEEAPVGATAESTDQGAAESSGDSGVNLFDTPVGT